MKAAQTRSAVPFADAVRTWHARIEADGCPARMPSELVALEDAVGRIPARIARTARPCPTYRAAAMDGYAIRSSDVARASIETPVALPLGSAAVPVDTGAAMPSGFDAVVPTEHVRAIRDRIDVTRATAAGKHVRLPGDDVPPGVAVGWPGLALRPIDCATLIAGGATTVEVVQRPRLAVIPTGDEVVVPGSKPKPGTVIESNSSMIAAQARAVGADVTVWPIVKDDETALVGALQAAIASADIVVVLAGSAAGKRDLGAAAIAHVGAVDVRGVATRPARPVLLGHAGAVPVVDLPGYPVSCHVAFDAYVAPLIRRLAGSNDPMPRRARLSEQVETDGLCDEWHLASLLTAPGSPRAVVVPLEAIGGGLYRLAQADARFALKRGIARFGRFAAVPWEPLRDADDASRPLFAGPYDPLIEEMASLGGFRCRWTSDASGEALDLGLADAVGVLVRAGDVAALRARAGKGRKMLPIGVRIEGRCRARAAVDVVTATTAHGADAASVDPWEGAAAVAAGILEDAACSRYVAERFALRFDEGEPASYAIVWEERPGHRFPWGIVLSAALSALKDVAPTLGWKSIVMTAEMTK